MIAQATGRDVYNGGRLARFYGRLTVVGGLAAVVGPLVGGALTVVMDCRGLFLVLAGIGAVILLWVAVGYGETLPAHARTSGGFTRVGGDMRLLLADRAFVGAVLVQGFVNAALFAYLSGARPTSFRGYTALTRSSTPSRSGSTLPGTPSSATWPVPPASGGSVPAPSSSGSWSPGPALCG